MGGYLHRLDLATLFEGQRPKVRDMSSPPALPLIDGRPIRPVKFPAYVPKGAKQWAMDFADNREAFLTGVIRERAEIEAAIGQCPKQDQKTLQGLVKRRDEVTKCYDHIMDNLAISHRLICDDRMEEVYWSFAKHFPEDDQAKDDFTERDKKIYGFLDAAYWAWMEGDYGQYRASVKQAKLLKHKIAETARNLAALLRQAELNLTFPYEFSLLASLLRQTDNPENSGWLSTREAMLGAPWEHYPKDHFPSDPDEQARLALGDNWLHAPRLSMVLARLATAAQQYEPKETGYIGAAIASQKPDDGRDYLRALSLMMVSDHDIPLIPPMRKAMEITAQVVMNDQEGGVTLQSVNEAIELLQDKGQLLSPESA